MSEYGTCKHGRLVLSRCEQCEKEGRSLALAPGSAPDRKGEYRAEFLWPHEGGSVQEAGYEFANGTTKEYQEFWWDILLKRAKAQNAPS